MNAFNIRANISQCPLTLALRLEADVRQATGQQMEALTIGLVQIAREEAPVRTATLAASISAHLTEGGRGMELQATATHASFVHYGTGVHRMHGAAHPVRKVVQKGMRPNPFFERAIHRSDPQTAFEEGISNYLSMRGW